MGPAWFMSLLFSSKYNYILRTAIPEYLIVTTDRSHRNKSKSYEQYDDIQYDAHVEYGGAETERNYVSPKQKKKKQATKLKR